MTPSPQIKTGKAVTMIQLLIAVSGLFLAAVGLYVKSEVRNSQQDDRITTIEKALDRSQAQSLILRQARNEELKELDQRIDKNSDDINILKVTKKDK